ncbi:hypothetical protein SLS61_005977 [Didymella pomorum]
MVSSRSEVEYGGLQGFQTLTALDCLDVPWHLILGSPGGFRNEQKCYEPTGDFQYPDLHDVLPNNLRHFKTSKDERSTPICAGIEQALYSLLPSSEEPNTLRLHSIEFAYNSAHYYNPLPVNFWRIQDAFQKAGVKFNYKLKLDPSDFWWVNEEGAKHNVNQFADTLAREGPGGVQIALRTGVLGLPERVMDILGLGKEWLDSEEAKEVMFGEKVDTWSKRGVDF